MSMDFNDRHQRVGDRPIFPNMCLPWMMLTVEERGQVLEDNDLFCKVCLRFLRKGRGGNTCGPGRHTINTGFNGMCSKRDCDKHVTHVKDMSLIIEINIKYTRNHWNGQRASDHRESRPHY